MKIGINCGHTLTGAGSGAVGIINESEHTRKIGKELIKMLDDNGHTVVDCTVDSAATQSAYLSKSVQIANSHNLDLFVSIHFNASNCQGHGTEIYTYKGKQHAPATRTLNNLIKYGFKNRGIKDGSGLYVIKNTKAEAMLIEVCFCDNTNDVNIYNNIGYMNIAKAIYQGITGTTLNNVTPQNNEIEQAKAIIKQKAGLEDATIQYLANYQYGESLLKKLANAMK